MQVGSSKQMKLNSGHDWLSAQWCGLSRLQAEIKERMSPAVTGNSQGRGYRDDRMRDVDLEDHLLQVDDCGQEGE